MLTFLWNAFVAVFFLYAINAVQKAFERCRKAYLIKIQIQFDVEKLVQDFMPEYLADEKEKAKEALEKPFVFTLYKDLFTWADIIFDSEGNASPSLYKECFKRKPTDVLDTGTIRIFLESGCIVCERVDERKETGEYFKRVFEFPFYVMDKFLMKTVGYGELKKLPDFLGDYLKEYGFEVANLAFGSAETFKAFEAEWLSQDSEIRSDFHWNRFRSEYAKVSLIYFPFSSEELSPFEQNLIRRNDYAHKKKRSDFFKVADKVKALKEKV
jgi:hypothetical protein